jgi:hypothetical protein
MSDISEVDRSPIQTHIDIDDMLMTLAAIDEQIGRYEDLKQHRIDPIDKEIKALTGKKEEYRSAINSYMTANNEKTLKYPGLAVVSRRSSKAKWTIGDEDALLDLLYAVLKERQPVLDKIVKVEPKLIKKELDKVLDELETQGALDAVSPDVVFKEPAKTTLNITFDKGEALIEQTKERRAALSSEPPTQVKDETQEPKQDGLDFDSLEI